MSENEDLNERKRNNASLAANRFTCIQYVACEHLE